MAPRFEPRQYTRFWNLLTMIHHFLLVTSSPSANLSTVTLKLSHIKKEFTEPQWLTSEKQALFSKRLYTTFPWSFWLGLHRHPWLLANAVAWAPWDGWFIDRSMLYSVSRVGFSQPARATQAWHLGERSWRKLPRQYAGTRLNSRPWLLRHTSAVAYVLR